MTADLSPDIALFHILPRLPAKMHLHNQYLKCVSKQWNSFITTPAFPKMHLHNQYQHKFLFLPHNTPWDFFTIDCETPEDGCTAFRPLPFKVRSGQEISIVTSFRGMVCVVLIKPVDIILWNPVTGDYKTFSKVGSLKDCYDSYKSRYGLYYNSSQDDYKLVCLTRYPFNIYIYSLKSDSWRKVDSTYDRYSYIPKRSVLFNEKFYFANSYSIMMFDTQTEKIRDIKTPHFVNLRTFCIGFIVVRDCIHLYVAIDSSIGRCNTIEQWRMDGDGDGDWTKVETCLSEQHLYWSYHEQQHCHLMRNGNWLMYSEKDLTRNKNWVINAAESCVYVLDAKKHTKEIMCSFKRAFRPVGKYVESFLSPNQYLNYGGAQAHDDGAVTGHSFVPHSTKAAGEVRIPLQMCFKGMAILHNHASVSQDAPEHLHHQNQQKLLFLPNNRPWDFFTIDCETPEDVCTATRPLPFKVATGQYLSIATSLHGMVCILVSKPADTHTLIIHDILLWNPVTGDHKTLSKTNSHKDCYDIFNARYGLCYSSSEDNYKLVCLTRYPFCISIYSLKSNSWRKIASTGWSSNQYDQYSHYSYWKEQIVVLNEKLYFANLYSIMMFDTQNEKIRDIKTPHFGNQRTCRIGFMVVRDCIYLYVAIANSISGCYTIEQWRMDGGGDWTKVETYCSSKEHFNWSFEPHHCHLMRNANWLMYSDNPQALMRNENWVSASEGCVYVLDAKNHTKHIICSFRRAYLPVGKYVESFVSPNQYLK